jgi:hypothetical protein
MEPYSAAQPGSRLEAGSQLKALRKARSKLAPEKKDPMAMMKALGQQAAAAKAKAAGTGLLATRDLYQCVPSLLPLSQSPAPCRLQDSLLRRGLSPASFHHCSLQAPNVEETCARCVLPPAMFCTRRDAVQRSYAERGLHACRQNRPIASAALHPCITSILQLAVLYGMGVVMVLCAYAGFSVTAVLLEVPARSTCHPRMHALLCLQVHALTAQGTREQHLCWLPVQALGLCTGMVDYAAGYATAGILALLSPLYLPFLPILAPVGLLCFLSLVCRRSG